MKGLYQRDFYRRFSETTKALFTKELFRMDSALAVKQMEVYLRDSISLATALPFFLGTIALLIYRFFVGEASMPMLTESLDIFLAIGAFFMVTFTWIIILKAILDSLRRKSWALEMPGEDPVSKWDDLIAIEYIPLLIWGTVSGFTSFLIYHVISLGTSSPDFVFTLLLTIFCAFFFLSSISSSLLTIHLFYRLKKEWLGQFAKISSRTASYMKSVELRRIVLSFAGLTGVAAIIWKNGIDYATLLIPLVIVLFILLYYYCSFLVYIRKEEKK